MRHRAPSNTSGLPPGHPLGRFEIVREVASGGFGTVYEGVHKHTRRRVALKVLHAHIADDDDNRERFLREVRAPARVEHDAMVEVFDADVDPRGQPWVAMEWLEGQTLRDVPATLDELLGYYCQLLDGLAAAHAAGVIHRDLKPENVFLEKGSHRVRLLDFGLAREQGSKTVTKEGISLGTPRYMSPEQLMNARTAGPPSDIWAVGVMLYEAIGGRPPFESGNTNALVVQILTEDHKRLDAPPALATLVDDCLAKEPTARLPNATALRERLLVVRRDLSSAQLAASVPLPGSGVPASQGASQPATKPARPPTDVATIQESYPFGAVSQPGEPATLPAEPLPRASAPVHPAPSSRRWVYALAALFAVFGLGTLGAAALWILSDTSEEASDEPPSGPVPGPLAPRFAPLPPPPLQRTEVVAPMRENPSAQRDVSQPEPMRPATRSRPASHPRRDNQGEAESEGVEPPPPPPPEGMDPLNPLRGLLPPI